MIARSAVQRRKILKRKNPSRRTMMVSSHLTHHIAMVSTPQGMTRAKTKLPHLSPTTTASIETQKKKIATRDNPTTKRMMVSSYPTLTIAMVSTHQGMTQMTTSSIYLRQMMILAKEIRVQETEETTMIQTVQRKTTVPPYRKM